MTKYQQTTLNEFIACYRLMHKAIDNPDTPDEVIELISDWVQTKLRSLGRRDLRPIVEAFIKADIPL